MSIVDVTTKPTSRIRDSHADDHRIEDLRAQAALVRALLDEFERLLPRSSAAAIAHQHMGDELERLGVRVLILASEIVASDEGEDRVFCHAKSSEA